MQEFILKNWWQLILISPVFIGPILGIILMIRNNLYEPLLLILIILGVLLGVTNIKAATYQYKGGLTIEAPDFRTAAKRCFYILNYKYTTEERGLEVIDICANGKEVK